MFRRARQSEIRRDPRSMGTQVSVKGIECRMRAVRVPCRGNHGERCWRAVGFSRVCPRLARDAQRGYQFIQILSLRNLI